MNLSHQQYASYSIVGGRIRKRYRHFTKRLKKTPIDPGLGSLASMAKSDYMNSAHDISTPTELNLHDLFRALWRKKSVILSCTLVGLIIAITYLTIAAEKWTSDSVVIKPSAVSMGGYGQKYTAYFRLGNLELTALHAEEIQNNAFNTFLLTISSRDMQEKMISETTFFRDLTQGMPEQDKTKTLDSLISNNLKAFSSDQVNPNEKIVAFTALTAQIAQDTLKTFLKQANIEALRILDANLNETINNRVLLLRQMAESLKASSEQIKANRIAQLKQARDSAIEAKIDTPFTKQESERGGGTIIDFTNPETLFLLGEKNLSAQLRSLEQAPTIYPASYYNYLNDARQLEMLLENPVNGTMYDFTKTPALPLFRDAPRKGRILVLGVLAGLFAGIFLVLLHFSATRQYNRT